MATRNIQHCQRGFNLSISNTLNFLNETENFRVLQHSGHHRNISGRTRELLAGLALLKICLSWEEFVENVFVRYMCGAISASGFSPTLLRPAERSASSAMVRLLGRRSYLNWSSTNIINRAGIYFDRGEPFTTAIGAGGRVLDEIFIVRNCFAHRSEFATQEFRGVLRTRIGYVPRGMTAGRFLRSINPVSGQAFIEFYTNILLGVSLMIAP